MSKPSSECLPDTKEYSKDDLMTPTNQRLNSDDSGYLSPRLNSDPDWLVDSWFMCITSANDLYRQVSEAKET